MHHSKIKEDMKVVGSDGGHVGTIDGVEGDQLKLTKQDSENGKHNFIAVDMVNSVDGDTVTLSSTAEDAKAGFDSNAALNEAGSAVGGA